jgi:hypothetical protein
MPGYIQYLRLCAPLIAALTLILLSPEMPHAQTSQSARDARRIDMDIRQRALRDLEKLNDRPPKKAADNRPAYRDVAADFEQLQVRNYSLSQAAQPDRELNYARIREDAAEVRKRALRLRGYLLLPDPGESQKQNKVGGELLAPARLMPAIASLDALVNSFAWNPVFRQPDVVDMKQSTKARLDLEGIIRLSEQIRKCADGLMKNAGQK